MSRVRIPRLQGDERGVALPLALVGLVAVTLLVSTALVTSTIELAISSAHQAATESLYLAEGGLEAFVAARGTVLHEIAGTGSIDFSPPGGAPVQITVVHLGNRQTADSTSLRLFSVRSTPAQGGRSVAAQVTQMLVPPRPLALDITSALMAGGHLDVAGTDARVNGRPLDAARAVRPISSTASASMRWPSSRSTSRIGMRERTRMRISRPSRIRSMSTANRPVAVAVALLSFGSIHNILGKASIINAAPSARM